MSKQTGIVVALLAILAIGAGVLTYIIMTGSAMDSDKNTPSQQESNNNTSTPGNSTVEPGDEAPARATVEVVFTDSGFDKDTYVLKAGTVLLIKNNSSQTLQLSSDDHPTHTLNGELNAPAIAPGETTALTPTTPGTYGVHDHIRSQFTTMIEVTE